MTLLDNAFAQLGAMPGDNRRALNEKADEAAMLSGADTEGALNQLMQMNRRISAELAWLPGATAEAADAFLAYARTVSQGEAAPIPPVLELGTALAQANALAPLFEIWPTDSPELIIGLCRALDGIIGQITTNDTLQAINEDRTKGGWEPISDEFSLAGLLNDHLRELCVPVRRSVEKILSDAAASDTLQKILESGEVDSQGVVAEAACDAYRMRVHEKAEKLKAEIDAATKELQEATSLRFWSVEDLQEKVKRWCSLTAPLRQIPGAERNDAKGIGNGLMNVAVNYFNHAGTVEKKKNVYVPIPNGMRTVTITYKSQTDAIGNVRKVTEWMKQAFHEQLELQNRIKESDATLKNMQTNEELMLSRAEADAYAGRGIRR